MKRISLILVCLILCLGLCACGNSVKEVKSEPEARAVLMQTMSDISDISKQLDEDYISDKLLEQMKSRLDTCLKKIESTEFYYELETVTEKYDNTMEQYKKTLKKYEKKVEELNKEKGK